MKSRKLCACALLFLIGSAVFTCWMLAQPSAGEATAQAEGSRSPLQTIMTSGETIPPDSGIMGKIRRNGKEEEPFSEVVMSYGDPVFGVKSTFIGNSLQFTIPGTPLRISAEDVGEPVVSRTFANAADKIAFFSSSRLPSGIVVAASRGAPPGVPVPPLVWQEISEEVSALLTDEQLERIEEIRQEFVKELAATGAKPNDPEYLQKWQRGRTRADLELIAVIGEEDFRRWQKEAHLPENPPAVVLPEGR